ncbi:hypothetical protein QYE76_006540 [Lolium multiflorum]|uniref:Knottins-like domain-containing protein n=1 Tax=Lolium multiflorum TaxID=4521 RepID=A0AAD8RV18_LOLMU|nr:hypothetical protein QYE76_006540 [Lolium multiflorum]
MESSRGSSAAAAVLVLVLLLVTTDVVTAQAKKKVCAKMSAQFKGACIIKVNCEQQCKKEGLPRGQCIGFRCTCDHLVKQNKKTLGRGGYIPGLREKGVLKAEWQVQWSVPL